MQTYGKLSEEELLRRAREKGFNSFDDEIKRLKEERVISEGYKNLDDWIEKVGNQYAINKGFKDYNEYVEHQKYLRIKALPYDKNKDCGLWLGCHVAERILPKIFEDPQRMPMGNKGYDFICKNGTK